MARVIKSSHPIKHYATGGEIKPAGGKPTLADHPLSNTTIDNTVAGAATKAADVVTSGVKNIGKGVGDMFSRMTSSPRTRAQERAAANVKLKEDFMKKQK